MCGAIVGQVQSPFLFLLTAPLPFLVVLDRSALSLRASFLSARTLQTTCKSSEPHEFPFPFFLSLDSSPFVSSRYFLVPDSSTLFCVPGSFQQGHLKKRAAGPPS